MLISYRPLVHQDATGSNGRAGDGYAAQFEFSLMRLDCLRVIQDDKEFCVQR